MSKTSQLGTLEDEKRIFTNIEKSEDMAIGDDGDIWILYRSTGKEELNIHLQKM